jgi:hypothetical protein
MRDIALETRESGALEIRTLLVVRLEFDSLSFAK